LATLDIDGISLEIDIVAWATERLTNAKQRSESWVSACCPFHDDHNPSFAVHIDEGVYACQACGAKGGFTKLFAHVEKMSMEDADRELIVKYGRVVPATWKALELDFGEKGTRRVEVSEVEAWPVIGSAYLLRRGISPRTQARFGAGQPTKYRGGGMNPATPTEIVMPWFSADGRRITHKLRSTGGKAFRYDPLIPSGQRRKTFYGIQLADDAERIVVVEGEITAMSVAEVDEVGLAAGTSNISQEQIALLRRIPAKEVVVFHDDDEPGRKMLALIVKGVGSTKTVACVDWTLAPTVKDRDANGVLRELGPTKVREMIDKRVPAPLTLKFE
jgi:DNA primase